MTLEPPTLGFGAKKREERNGDKKGREECNEKDGNEVKHSGGRCDGSINKNGEFEVNEKRKNT